ncbi:MAG: response regulator transcription factor [Chloroflexi bacterium]|nr:response regulator transcription factor [Chloroflexota bacterium]
MKVLLVDDHPVFREGLAALLGTRSIFHIVGQASEGAEAVDIARKLAPDLVLMDINMPGMNGIEATRQIHLERPDTRIVVLTVSEEEEDLFEAVRAGAQGYIVKNLASREVLDLIEKAAQGEAAFTPRVASRALMVLSGRNQAGRPFLTPRERVVLEQLVHGHSNAVIARNIGLSETTVRFHLRNILSKLHAKGRTEAAIKAVQQHIVRPPPVEKDAP